MLKQNISLLILVAAMKIYLLHAKSLKIAEKPQLSVHPHEDTRWKRTSIELPCSPDGDQLENFSRLYNNSNSISLLSGNTIYYSLKAERKRNEFTVVISGG